MEFGENRSQFSTGRPLSLGINVSALINNESRLQISVDI